MGKGFQIYLMFLLVVAISIGAFCIIYPLVTAPDETITASTTAPTVQPSTDTPEVSVDDETAPPTQDAEASTESQVVVEPIVYDQAVLDVIADMTLREKLYQLLYVTPEAITGVETATVAGSATKEAIAEYPVGGIIYFADNVSDNAQIKEMLQNTQSYSDIPLFLGTDEEGGIVSRLGSNTKVDVTRLQSMSNYSNVEEIYDIGKTLGEEMTVLGFNMNFAPVADVSTSSSTDDIAERSFSSDPEDASAMVGSMVSGLQDGGVSATLKHFPGMGTVTSDTHDGTATSDATYEELVASDFLPFIAGIAAGTDFVMVGHQTMTNLVDGDIPACLSSYIVTDLLRNQLGFEGVIITDAMNMDAIDMTAGEATIAAINAGVDMVLMPGDLNDVYSALVDAINEGTLTEERVNQSLYRILKVKMDNGLFD